MFDSKQNFWLLILGLSLLGAVVFSTIVEQSSVGPEDTLSLTETSDKLPDDILPEKDSSIRRALIYALPSDQDWLSGIERFTVRSVGPESPHWHNPLAAQPLEQSLIARQDNLVRLKQALTLIEVNTGKKFPTSEDYDLIIERGGRAERKRLPVTTSLLGPFAAGQADTRVWLQDRGGWFSSAKPASGKVTLKIDSGIDGWASAALQPGIKYTEKLGSKPLTVQLRAASFSPLANADADGSALKPKVYSSVDLERYLSFTSLNSGTISFNNGDARDYLRLKVSQRYTALLFFSDQPIADNIRCHALDDTVPVGRAHESLGLYSVATNGHKSLDCVLSVYKLDAGLKYNFIAISHDEPPFKPLILGFLGRNLLKMKSLSVDLTDAQIREAVTWLNQVYAVKFTAADLESMEDTSLRERLTQALNGASS